MHCKLYVIFTIVEYEEVYHHPSNVFKHIKLYLPKCKIQIPHDDMIEASGFNCPVICLLTNMGMEKIRHRTIYLKKSRPRDGERSDK